MTVVVGLDTGSLARFWRKVAPREPAACWVWQAYLDSNGYGRFSLGGRAGGMVGAHVVSYVMHYGLVPAGLEVHHLCRTRSCVNPHHLQAVTHAENCAAANSSAAQVNAARQRAVTHCPRNHAYDAANTHVRPGGARRCRACQREAERARRAAQ